MGGGGNLTRLFFPYPNLQEKPPSLNSPLHEFAKNAKVQIMQPNVFATLYISYNSKYTLYTRCHLHITFAIVGSTLIMGEISVPAKVKSVNFERDICEAKGGGVTSIWSH